MSRVFVVQVPLYWDHTQNKMLPKFDLSAAEEYGEIEYLFTSKETPHPGEVVAELRNRLAGIQKEDYILLIGSPSLIGVVAAMAAQRTGGSLRMLQWDRKTTKYLVVEVGGLDR